MAPDGFISHLSFYLFCLTQNPGNLFRLLAFIFFIGYIELLFWYMAFFTIVGKSLVEAFGILKAPIDVLLLPVTLVIYGDKNVFGLAISLVRLGFLLIFLPLLVEYGVMATFAWRGGHQFNFPLWLTYILTIAFPILEIVMTRGIETNLFLTGTKQKPKKYWENIWKGIRLIASRRRKNEV